MAGGHTLPAPDHRDVCPDVWLLALSGDRDVYVGWRIRRGCLSLERRDLGRVIGAIAPLTADARAAQGR